MNITRENLAASRLWAAAEGRAMGVREGRPVMPTRAQVREAQYRVAESIAAGEFPTQILPDVKRTLRTVFEEVPRVTDRFTTRLLTENIDVDEQYQVASFGDQSNIPALNQGQQFIPGGLPRIGPREKYPQIGMTASGKTYRSNKIGEAFGIDWEAIVRSRGAKINLIRTAFETFGRHAGNQEEIDVFSLLVSSGGFRTGANLALNAAKPATVGNGFSVANADLSNPLDFAAAVALSNQAMLTVGTSGTTQTVPVNYTSYVLLTTPERAPFVKATMAARRITKFPGSTTGNSWEEALDFGADIEVIGAAWLKKLWPAIGKGWILIPVIAGDDLPVLTSNFLEGYEEPSVWIKDSNARNVAGGAVNSLVDGDFDSDALETKVRHVHGANFMWTDGIVYSTGANA